MRKGRWSSGNGLYVSLYVSRLSQCRRELCGSKTPESDRLAPLRIIMFLTSLAGRVELRDLGNKNMRWPLTFEFQTNHKELLFAYIYVLYNTGQYCTRHTYTKKLSVVYLKFKLNGCPVFYLATPYDNLLPASHREMSLFLSLSEPCNRKIHFSFLGLSASLQICGRSCLDPSSCQYRGNIQSPNFA